MENVRRCVYLAGPVEYEGDTWRERAATALEKLGFEPINPIRGEQLKRVGKHIESDVADKVIVMRDLNDLRRVAITGGVVIMNLNNAAGKSGSTATKDGGRQPTGTLFELQWCYDNQVPVIAIMGRDCDPNIRTHPWVRTEITYAASSVTAALEMVESYFT